MGLDSYQQHPEQVEGLDRSAPQRAGDARGPAHRGRDRAYRLPVGVQGHRGPAGERVLSAGRQGRRLHGHPAVTRDDAGLAAVLGHEVAHAVARHGGERMSQTAPRADRPRGDADGAGRQRSHVVQSVTALLGAGATVGLLLPWNRSQESEADHLGLIYMAKAGYNPIAARDLWVRMGNASRNSAAPPAFLSTHPSAGYPGHADRRLDAGSPQVLPAPLRPAPQNPTTPGGMTWNPAQRVVDPWSDRNSLIKS